MRQFTRTAVTFGILIILISGLYVFTNWFSRTTGYVLGEDEKIRLAQCLKTNGAIFYSSSTCPLCEQQLELFGEDAARFLEVATCENIDECPAGGVPAWKLNGQIVYGMKNFNELNEMSGCAIE